MKAIRIHEDGGPEVLRYEEAPDPSPAPGEVLIGLKAASLNHLDIWLRRGLPSAPKPRILGADGAGVVVGLGEGVDRFTEGDEVVINPGLDEGAKIVGEHMDGTHAELITLPAEYVYPLPDGLSFEESAAFPLVFETAYRMLVTRAGLQEGEWVFVWGIGSGVATASLQIAKALGARVIGTAGPANHDWLKELGADEVLDYNAGPISKQLDTRVDAVVDLIGGDSLEDAPNQLEDPSRVVSVIDADTVLAQGGHYVFVRPSRENLQALTELVESGRLTVSVARTFGLDDTAAAHRFSEEGHPRGKVAITI